MATSGSTDFTLRRNEIVQEALELLGQFSVGETISAEDLASSVRSLNMLVKSWQAQGLHLWTKTEGTLFLAKGQQSYNLGASGDNATESYAQTALTADAASGATSLTVGSITGISDGDYLGVELDDGTLQWTTVSGAPTGGAITAAASLDGAASSGNAVFAYTTKLQRPLRVLSARRHSIDGDDVPIHVWSREDYMDLSTKGSEGAPVQVAYSPQLGEGVMYVWPTADDVTDVINFTFTRQLQDFDATDNTPDLPQEWLLALTYNLAVLMAPKFGLPMQDRAWLKREAEQYKAQAEEFDQEWAPVFFQPWMEGY